MESGIPLTIKIPMTRKREYTAWNPESKTGGGGGGERLKKQKRRGVIVYTFSKR